jgi:hypothetical protein
MATINTTAITLLDALRGMDPNGKQARIAELLNQDGNNELLAEMGWKEGNLITGERMTVRDTLPTVDFRRLNEGVAYSKGTVHQVDEAAAMLEGNSEVDRKVAILAQDVGQFRLNNSLPFLEAMSQKMAQTVIYGNAATSPKEFTGIMPRFNDLDGPTADQIIDAGGTGTDNRSILLIDWGPEKVGGLYPKGTKGGLQHWDATANMRMADDGHPIGDKLLDSQNRPYFGYSDHYEWNAGFYVKDPRYVIRIANIDASLLTRDASTGALLQDLMVQALERIQGGGGTFYMPRLIRSFLRRQLLTTKNAYLGYEDVAGKKVLTFGEARVRRVDAMNVDEARVTT